MSKIEELAKKHLGQHQDYSDQYDASLLVSIPRKYNREHYQIDEQNLPFVGCDVWHAYEISVLTEKGLPVSGILKITVPCDTPDIFESKSLKLYLNSFNMTRLGNNQAECIALLETRIRDDLSKATQGEVQCHFFNKHTAEEDLTQDYTPLSTLCDLDAIDFTVQNADASFLAGQDGGLKQTYRFQTDLLRSNCRVTNQPDWGDVFIHLETSHAVDFKKIAEYIVSHRKLNHFHEEICEMIYTHFQTAFKPEKLSVLCLYTRRGGIDINPFRASHTDLIPEAFGDVKCLFKRTIRQ